MTVHVSKKSNHVLEPSGLFIDVTFMTSGALHSEW